MLTIFSLFLSVASAQDFEIPNRGILETDEGCREAEFVIEKIADYMLSTSIKDKSSFKSKAVAFLLRWTSHSPDYVFEISDHAMEVSEQNPALMGIYLAAMAKEALLNQQKEVSELGTFHIFLAYCEDPISEVELTEKLSEWIAVKQAGKLESYILKK